MPTKVQRQANIAWFFNKPNAQKATTEARSIRDSPEPPTKRRKLGSPSTLPPYTAREIGEEGVSISAKLLLDDDYPPPDHPSYHPPPGPTYNHPIVIPRVPDSLLSTLRFNTKPKLVVKPELGLDLQYFKAFIAPSCSAQLTQYLLDSLPWYRVKYTVRGIDINTPRYTTVFGKDATSTPWTGYDKAEPRAIPRILLKLMQQVEEVTGMTYNFALVNYYSSGADSISYHSDSESFLGPNPCIASISLGAPRDFMLRHISYQTNKAPVEKFTLTDGDMVVMRGRTQHDWQHSIPKRKNAEGRINITFRKGIVKYATQNYYQYNVGKGPMYRRVKGRMVETS